jgi:cytosine/uracil/thiamine/allantoin permease
MAGHQVLIAAVGFRAIAAFEKWTVPVTLVVVLLMTVVGWTRSGVHWAAIMLIHYWVIARQRIPVNALFDPPGRSRIADVHRGAVAAFVAGIVATWAFSYGVPAFLQGPAARALGGTDLSWLAGALVAGGIYYAVAAARIRSALAAAEL